MPLAGNGTRSIYGIPGLPVRDSLLLPGDRLAGQRIIRLGEPGYISSGDHVGGPRGKRVEEPGGAGSSGIDRVRVPGFPEDSRLL